MNLEKYLEANKNLIDSSLDEFLPGAQETPAVIHDAMRYSVFAGGKRLRPILVLASAQAVGGDPNKVLPAACALEMVHTYSLIHDDLPSMDNDDYRRGKLTSHKVYGEAMAILAGDALLTLAFEVLVDHTKGIDPLKVNLAVVELARAAGSMGMVGGQVADILSEGKRITGKDLEYIHRHKTAALFGAALRMGAILSHAEQWEIDSLSNYALHLGLAFQIVDDVLDVTGEAHRLGKEPGGDIKNMKATYPSLYSIEESRARVSEEIEQALGSISSLGPEADPLRKIVNYVGTRDY